MDQIWLEMHDIRARALATAVWMPLRAANQLLEVGKYGHVGYQTKFYSTQLQAVAERRESLKGPLNTDGRSG